MEPVIISVRNQHMEFMIPPDLLRNESAVLLREIRDIELISERSRQRHICSCFKRRISSDLLVRAFGDMRTHSRQRINKPGSLLNPEPLNGIGVIGAPDLRAVVQHPRVKTSAASGAVLQKKIREICDEPFLHFIDTQHIAVEKLALPFSICSRASDIRKIPVHVPFHVVDRRTLQDICNPRINLITDLLS